MVTEFFLPHASSLKPEGFLKAFAAEGRVGYLDTHQSMSNLALLVSKIRYGFVLIVSWS